MASVNEQLLDQAIRHSHYLERYKGGVYNRVLRLLERAESDVLEQIRKRGEDGTIARERLNALLDDIQEILGERYAEFSADLRDELTEAAAYEADFAARKVESTLPVKMELSRPDEKTLEAVALSRPFQGKNLQGWLDNLESTSSARVRDQIRIGVVEQESVQAITKRVQEVAFTQNRRNAEAVTRTAVQHTMSNAREMTYQENRDVIKAVTWVSTLDTDTTAICRARDGQEYPPDSGPRPPAHVGCRSSTAPVTRSWEEMGIDANELTGETRASMNGQVPASKSYGDWLAGQNQSVQEEVLGQKKAKLFREGGLTIDQFTGPRGGELTLEELAARHRDAFEKAGLD